MYKLWSVMFHPWSDEHSERKADQCADVCFPTSHDGLQTTALDVGVNAVSRAYFGLQSPLLVPALPADFSRSPDSVSRECAV